ncbi:MAG: PIN domain-containing protein [Chthoniobacterales bacterium]|nr:MAG: PIN domain-containing protein [Chthoniobacterales bacterium]
MVTYWDTSALVPLVLKESTSAFNRRLADQLGVVTWWGSYIECVAAITRQAREGASPPQIAESFRMLEQLASEWTEVAANEELRRAAVRALRTHRLRWSDALQLGAAMVASRFEPPRVRFVTHDLRLRAAAELEGFMVN